jgi:hypothetical protein
VLAEKRAEFIELFRKFIDSYPPTPQGEDHLRHYEEEREEGRRNFEAILEAERRGEDVTDEVLMKLLPYAGSKPNRERGFWISIAPAFNGDVRKKFESAGWTDQESWPQVAKEILRFVRRCYDRPEELKAACDEFSDSPYSKGFQSGTLTPILHALRPEDFILINNKSRRAVNYFSGTSYSSSLSDYPSINETARSLVNDISDHTDRVKISGIRFDDLFDMFTHWLAVRPPKTSNIWWVNQGSNLDLELDGGYLWAPTKSKTGRKFYHWDNLSDLVKDDIILHYANGCLRYASRVIEPSRRTRYPHAIDGRNWSEDGNLVKVDYHELKPPIPLDKFSQSLSKLDINQGPLNNNGGVKQGYLFRLNLEGLDIIRRSQPETDWPDFLGPTPPSEYPLYKLAEDTGFDLETLERWVRAIRRKGQAVLYGPPGTGKTYVAEHLAKHLIGGTDGFSDLVQFHPAYAYEDFIQGIRPQSDDDGGLRYPLVPGRFLEFCERADSRRGTCVLIIDEINRANLSQVFGELMYLLEYRSRSIPLAGGGRLRIPKNVLIIGTMNTADRSIALVDHALRRRFAFLRLQPNHEVLRKYHQSRNTGFPVEGLIGVLRRLNAQVNDPHYEVGISFFLRKDLAEEIEDIWKMEVEPYLDEYFFDRTAKAEEFRWDKVRGEIAP